MFRFAKNIIIITTNTIDHIIFLMTLLFSLTGLLFALPWVLKQRKIWQKTACGNQKAVILLPIAIEKLKHRGHEHLFPLRNPSMKWIGLLDSTNTQDASIKISKDLDVITWRSPRGVNLLKKVGLKCNSILLRELAATKKIMRYCVTEQIGVIRTYQHHYTALRCCLVSLLIKIPFIVDIAGNYELLRRLNGKTFYFKQLWRVPVLRKIARLLENWLLGWPLRKAFRVLGRNKNNYEHAFALGAPVEQLFLVRINNFGAAFNSYNPEALPERPADYPYMLFVGRLKQEKFPLDVFDAFVKALPQLPECRLVIIGDGPLKETLERKIADSGCKESVVLLGSCPNELVLNWTAHAMGAICPYSGSTLVEAMLCGVPIIAYDVEWHAEVIIDDHTGFLVPFRSIADLAEKLVYVANNHEEARNVGQQGRDLARALFNKDKISKMEGMHYLQALEHCSEGI